MNLQTLISTVLKASLWLNVLAIGLRATTQDTTYFLRKPGELLRAILAMNVLMPAFVVCLVYIFDLTPAVKIALVMLSVSPIPPLLPNKLVKSGGTGSYAVGLLVTLCLLAIVFVPLAMEIIELVFNIPLQMTAASIATFIFITALLPLGLGIALHHLAPVLVERFAKPISKIAGIGLLVGVAAMLFAAAPAIWTLVGNGTVLAFAAFVFVGLAIGHFLGGPLRENRTSLAVATSSRHPGIAIALATANFPEQKLAMAAVLLYLLVNGVVSIPYHKWTKRRQTGVAIPAGSGI